MNRPHYKAINIKAKLRNLEHTLHLYPKQMAHLLGLTEFQYESLSGFNSPDTVFRIGYLFGIVEIMDGGELSLLLQKGVLPGLEVW